MSTVTARDGTQSDDRSWDSRRAAPKDLANADRLALLSGVTR